MTTIVTQDHPHLRQSIVCPVCGFAKDKGLVTCWGCHRSLKHYPNDIAEKAIENAEIRARNAANQLAHFSGKSN